jgi:hypothetical protein
MTDWIGVYAAIIGTIGFALTMYFAHMPNKLDLELDKRQADNYGDAVITNQLQTPKGRFFHVRAVNKHVRKTARNCKVYITSLKEEAAGKELLTQELPLKWRGYQMNLPSIDVPPNKAEKFDAFFVLHNEPDRILMQAFVDSTAILPNVKGNKKLRAKYRITADGFKAKEKEFIITLSSQLSDVKIEPL